MADARSITERLDQARRELLDLSTRNRLISTARRSNRSSRLEIVDERSSELFRILVQEGKNMTFLPAPEAEPDDPSKDSQIYLPQPELDEVAEQNGAATAEHHIDRHLQTSLSSDKLQKRLLQLYRDARTYEEEQGVNILYLAMGFLRWYEDEKSDRERFAPLILVPVRLSRSSAGARFRLAYTDDEITTNLSLKEKLRSEFGIELPDVSEVEELSPEDYFEQVRHATAKQSRWEVLGDDVVLWFYSFSKFLMYRDLQPETWPENRALDGHPLVHGLVDDGFDSEPPIFRDDQPLDDQLDPLEMIHVTDADSSQTIAIEEVRRGRNLVIQGPPGTGKSQTITNLIATAVREGKKVLFVAEKMAALDVVHRRLENLGLGDVCLELHSSKSRKKAVLDELERTLSLGRPKLADVEAQASQLKSHRDRLNRHAHILHQPLKSSGTTPYRAIGELVRLRAHGVPPANFTFPNCTEWSSADFRERCTLIEDLVQHLQELGDPQQHPWRGVQLAAVLPTDSERLANDARQLAEQLRQLSTHAQQLADALRLPPPSTLREVSDLALLAQKICKAPPLDRAAIADEVWLEQRPAIEQVLSAVSRCSEIRRELAGVVSEAGWASDVASARRDHQAYGRKWWRWLSSSYRKSLATLRGILVDEPPKSFDQRMQIFDLLIAGQKVEQRLGEATRDYELGQRAFGSHWRGTDTDVDACTAILHWEQATREMDVPHDFRAVLQHVDHPQQVASALKQVARRLKPCHQSLGDHFKKLRLDMISAFAEREASKIPLDTLEKRLTASGENAEGLNRWVAYFTRCTRLIDQSLGSVVKLLDQGTLPANEARDQFLHAYYEQLMRAAYTECPELAGFNGGTHEQVLKSFQELDRERIRLAQQEVALAHYEGMPRHESSAGELGVLRREMKKKRRHLPLRRLLEEAGHAIQAIKPVMMMSPMSVAQYLTPGVLEFDLLLIDEASQVQPVDALGAIARTRQMVVVGDERQLPPTTFFAAITGNAEEESDDGVTVAADMESILGLCQAQGVRPRMLRWHYRSRHHSLIAVSNYEFYDSQLFVVPSPYDHAPDLGVKLHYLPQAVFDRGASRTNRVEAQAVADAVMEHAAQNSGQTLGVGAFSVAQRDAILDELELRRREHSELEAFFHENGAEPFFVKNLENIQGDERDVILISVGYGKDADGRVSMNFGPLNSEGGERRLNVLISRARQRCEVFSGITDDDIDLNRTKSHGVKALKSYLKYARTGQLDVPVASDRDHDSVFEEEVARAIQNLGYEVIPQTEESGFFIDLAVVNPDRPGQYLLGIECDGASYHSARWARDRDRIRQEILEDRGWTIHRIWSTDWFQRPDDELRKVVAAIDAARTVAPRVASSDTVNDATLESTAEPAVDDVPDVVQLERESAGESSAEAASSLSIRYVEACFPVDQHTAIHELAFDQLGEVVVEVVNQESPIHQDEVARRVTQLWGLSRTGSRIATAVEAALEYAENAGRVERDGLFWSIPNQVEFPIRDRSEVSSTTLRKTEHLPPAEIRAALEALVAMHTGVSEAELVVEASNLLGLGTKRGAFREIARDEIYELVRCGRCEVRSDRIYAAQRPLLRAME